MLGLLAEYGFWPPVANASCISDSVKVSICKVQTAGTNFLEDQLFKPLTFAAFNEVFKK